MKAHDKILCPSSKCKTGSEILGVRQDDSTVAILPQTLPVDETFIAQVNQDGVSAEQKFRFTNKCVEGGCAQWTGSSCGVIEKVLTVMNDLPVKDTLPVCGIRNNCRWFYQSGSDACKVCVFVITEVTQQDILAEEVVYSLA